MFSMLSFRSTIFSCAPQPADKDFRISSRLRAGTDEAGAPPAPPVCPPPPPKPALFSLSYKALAPAGPPPGEDEVDVPPAPPLMSRMRSEAAAADVWIGGGGSPSAALADDGRDASSLLTGNNEKTSNTTGNKERREQAWPCWTLGEDGGAAIVLVFVTVSELVAEKSGATLWLQPVVVGSFHNKTRRHGHG